MKKYFFISLLFGLTVLSPCFVAFGDGDSGGWRPAVASDGTKGVSIPLNNDVGGKSFAGGCENKKIGKECKKTGVQKGICVNVAKKGDPEKLSCAARICDTGYLLELYSNGKSKGICRTEQFAKDQCKKRVKTCPDGKEAVPMLMKNPNNPNDSSDTRAYKECFCANKNMVIYKCGEGASGTPPTDPTTYTNMQDVIIKNIEGCTKAGSTFTQWRCGDTMYEPGAIINIENGITCVAQWDTNEYTVTFDWGAGATEVVEYTYGTYVTLPGVGNHTKDGHTFSGWTKEGENFASGQSVSVSGDATYVAQWKKCDACNPGKGCNCELKVESNKCTYVTTPQSGYNITDGQNTNAPQCVLVRKQDCESAGGVWSGNGCKCNPDVPNAYFDIVNKTCVCIDSKKVFNKARTLCEDPEQELVTHNITFNLNGGTGCEDNTYIVGEDNPVDCQPTKSGYKVAGWTMSANNQTTLIPMPYIIPDTANSNITFTVEWEKVITCPESDNMPPECDCSGEKIYNSSTNTCDCPSNKPADASGNCVEPKRCPSDSVGTYPKCRCTDTDKKYDSNKNECVIDELKKAYEDAKAKEQSLENRMLTATTVAATGIGGMELARGFSEQQADKNARNDMLGYVSTFRCEYGNGNNVVGGPEEIQLPVIDLTANKTKYKELAASIKVRKEALGMKPGLESEEILEKTTLYDEENTGITGSSLDEGSIYRAEILGIASDQEKIKSSSEANERRVKGGATSLGGGIVGGITGNSAINGKIGEKIKEIKNKKSDKK